MHMHRFNTVKWLPCGCHHTRQAPYIISLIFTTSLRDKCFYVIWHLKKLMFEQLGNLLNIRSQSESRVDVVKLTLFHCTAHALCSTLLQGSVLQYWQIKFSADLEIRYAQGVWAGCWCHSFGRQQGFIAQHEAQWHGTESYMVNTVIPLHLDSIN